MSLPQHEFTVLEQIKALSNVLYPSINPAVVHLPALLRQHFIDKDYPIPMLAQMPPDILRHLIFRRLLRRNNGDSTGSIERYVTELAAQPNVHFTPVPAEKYLATDQQNKRIDAACARFSPNRDAFGWGIGTATTLRREENVSQFFSLGDKVRATKILIIGGGVSGVMVSRVLRQVGFTNVSMIEAKDKIGGIWQQENVYKGTRNNPRDISFDNSFSLPRAPGSGQSVRDFATGVFSGTTSLQAEVTAIVGRDLDYTVKYIGKGGNKEPIENSGIPIVINCTGIGKPRPLSDPERMTTTANLTLAGPRWQQIVEAKDVKGKSIVIIGLGNSTAEMMQQFDALLTRGVDFDYHVLTHYPDDAIYNPEDTVINGGKSYRVFRDLSIPDLTSFQGDLEPTRDVYFKALSQGRIIGGVKHWEREKSKGIGIRFKDGRVPRKSFDHEFACDACYTLIGYSIDQQRFEALRIPYDSAKPVFQTHAIYDFDGEFSEPNPYGDSRKILKGYFGLGPVLETPLNKNAIVIPGNVHRLHDLQVGVILRAFEYQYNLEQKS